MYVQMLDKYIENIEKIKNSENIGYFRYFRYFRKYHNIFQPCVFCIFIYTLVVSFFLKSGEHMPISFSTVFYSASALLAMLSAVLARGIPSVCPSVCLSVTFRYCVQIRSCGFQHLVGRSL